MGRGTEASPASSNCNTNVFPSSLSISLFKVNVDKSRSVDMISWKCKEEEIGNLLSQVWRLSL